MRHGKKIVALTGVLMVTCALSSCSMNSVGRTMDAYLGNERTMPDEAEGSFGAPRPPILNPLPGSAGMMDNGGTETPARRVPAGNNAYAAQNATRAVDVAVASPSAGKRRVPVENRYMLQQRGEPAVASAPVMPVTEMASSTPEAALQNAMASAPAPEPALAALPEVQPAPAAAPVAASVPADDWGTTAQKLASSQPSTGKLKLIPPATPRPGEMAAAAEAPAAAPVEQAAAEPAPTAAMTGEPAPMAAMTGEPAAAAEPAPMQVAMNETPAQPEPQAAAQQPQQEPAPVIYAAPVEYPADAQPVQPQAAETAATAETAPGYPALAGVPETPPAISPEQVRAEMIAMEAHKAATQESGQALLADPSATVMTSASTGELVTDPASALPSPATGLAQQPVAAAEPLPAVAEPALAAEAPLTPAPELAMAEPAAAAPQPAEKSGFDGWLSSLFSSKKDGGQNASDAASGETLAATPLSIPQAEQPQGVVAAEAAAAPAEAAAAPAEVSSAPAVAPLKLSAPQPDAPATPEQELAGVISEPAAEAGAKPALPPVRYLYDSRYSTKRNAN